jgi:hypothetical protein
MTFDTAEMTERHVAACRRMAVLAEELAVEAHACVQAAGTPEQKTQAIAAFHRACRSARQSMALEAMLVRRHLADLRGESEDEERLEAMEDGRVRGHVRAGNRLIWYEAEHTKKEEWYQFLDRVAAGETARLKSDPPAWVAFLEERLEAVRSELDAARDALARGAPQPDPTQAGQPDFRADPDSS